MTPGDAALNETRNCLRRSRLTRHHHAGHSTIPCYRIASARPVDAAALPAIELAAARLLVGYAPDAFLHETTNPAIFADAQRRGHLWVAVADDTPVGFAHVELLEPAAAHLIELDVHPHHGRRGLGRRLVLTVCAWAAATGYDRVTLTTFRDVPWNMPFYQRLGFDAIPDEAITPPLRAILDNEARQGIDPARRVAMRRSSRVDDAAWPDFAHLRGMRCRSYSDPG